MITSQSTDDDDIISLNGDLLFVEELEQRLELALAFTAAPSSCDFLCGCNCGALETCRRACAY